MVFRKKSLTRLSFILAMFGALLVHSAAAQESASAQSAISMAKRVKPDRLVEAGVESAPIQSNQSAQSFVFKHHALSSAPPVHIASDLANANLPPTSPKRFSLPGISRANFLAATRVRPGAWRYFSTPSVNTSKLRSDKDPDLGHTQ